jgi:hypothetical protein
LGTLRVIIYWIWAITGIIRDGGHLDVWICEAICKDDRRKIDLGKLRNGSKGKFFVLVVDNGSDVGCIRATITFCGKMERQIGVLWEAGDEESEESVDINTSYRARIHRRAVGGVRVPDTNRLVKENDVGTLVP